MRRRFLAREARPVILVLAAGLAFALIYKGAMFAGVLAVPALFIVFLVRDPGCVVPAAPLGIISPVSGRVVSVEQARDEFLDRNAWRIRLRNGITDVHALRSPTEGKVTKRWRTGAAGGRLKRVRSFHLCTDEGDDLVLSLVMGPLAFLVRANLVTGERTGQGEVRGFMYLTGLVDVYVPENSRIDAQPGDPVFSGTTILGAFVHDDED